MRSRSAVAALVVANATTGYSGGDTDTPDRAARADQAPQTSIVAGPLCDLLPSGDDPGAPETLRDNTTDIALQWIPLVTTLEAAARAAGLADDLRRANGITILAPTDEAFSDAFERQTLDDLYCRDIASSGTSSRLTSSVEASR